jgi:phosphotransferase system HPr-like phosphotransfer protein
MSNETKTPVVERNSRWKIAGLHAQPAAQKWRRWPRSSKSRSSWKGRLGPTPDLLTLLALDCPQGTRLVIRATGPQAHEAAAALFSLFASKFGEK